MRIYISQLFLGLFATSNKINYSLKFGISPIFFKGQGDCTAITCTFATHFPFRFAEPAGVVKLVDTPDLGSGASRHGGSSPSTRTVLLIG